MVMAVPAMTTTARMRTIANDYAHQEHDAVDDVHREDDVDDGDDDHAAASL